MMRTRILMFVGTLLAAPVLTACSSGDDIEPLGTAEEATGPTGDNNILPKAADSGALAHPVTNGYSLTTPTNADPLQLCRSSTIDAAGCTMRQEWEDWMTDPNVDTEARASLMKGIAKCAVESSFTIKTWDGSQTFKGQWALYTSWKNNRLNGADKRERVSACIISLLNGNNQTLKLCVIGPGGAPFSDPCTDDTITTREGGFFGDLFASNPTAYIVGPDTDQIANTGRICTSNQTSYCCAESDTACPHRIVLAGAMEGAPDQNFANRRCNSFETTGQNGKFRYCTSFFSTREPNRTYTNVFTSFVPPLQ